MKPTPEQHDAIMLDGNLVVTAGAGSGKTRVLVERYLRLLTTVPPGDSSSLLAITFTEKAAREMRDRVWASLESRARAAPREERQVWEDRRTAVESARIGTIHSFCAALLRDHFAETGLDPRFTVLDEVETGVLLAESVDRALSKAAQAPLSLFETYSPDELRTILADLVRGGAPVRAAFDKLPPTPDALLHMWQRQLDALKPVLCEEMMSKRTWGAASAEVQELAAVASPDDRIGAQVRSLASLLSLVQAQKGNGGEDVAGTHNEETSPVSMLLSALATIDLRGGSKRAWPSADHLAAAKDALRCLRESYTPSAPLLHLTCDEALEQRAAQAVYDLGLLYRAVLEAYTQRKVQQDSLDFDDLVCRTRDLLAHHPLVQRRWQAELRAVLVDEFQDTDHDQRAIIYALAGFQHAPGSDEPPDTDADATSLFIVGDGKQSIYRFRGADVSVFRQVESDSVARGGKTVQLATSFRTHPLLLGWVNQVAGAVLSRERALQPYEVAFEPLCAHRPQPPHACCVELHIVAEGEENEGEENTQDTQDTQDTQGTTADDPALSVRDVEARILAERIRTLVADGAAPLVYDEQQREWRTPGYGDIALLFRASTVFEHYEQAFRAARIPYLTSAGRGYYGRKEVQDMIHLLRVLNNPSDDLALVGVLRSPLFALKDATIVQLRFANPHRLWDALMHEQTTAAEGEGEADEGERVRFARETLHSLHQMRGHQTVVELLREALATTGYMAVISGLHDGDRRRANVEKLIESARRAGREGLSGFSTYLDTLLKTETREGEAPLEAEGSVRLMTIHRSKGLEFPVVVLPDLGRGSPPQRDHWLAHQAYGVGLRLRDDEGRWCDPVAYQMARWEEQRMEQAERERLLYVALTRARDYLILSGPSRKKSGSDFLSTILVALDCPWENGGPSAGQQGAMHVWRYHRTRGG